MEIPPKYDPIQTEEKWYQFWLDQGFFHSEPDDREPFCVVIPPPNVTGVLHMGHMLNNTIQDVLVRRARMQGKNALWLPGTDHASIATEAKVVAKLKEEGIEKSEIGREAFLEHAWRWKEKHGGIILKQLRHLGASCDWSRTRFTMDPALYESVIRVFVDLYKKGLIYRGVRMVNWDPKALTALSDEEVIYKEVQSKLYYVRYAVEGEEDSWVTIATTRPETILGDTAVCVHPEDERYAQLKGKKVLLPLLGRSIPIIQDEYVDREFGTGCLKITPAHDENDYHIGIRHKLPSIDILNDNGTLSKEAEMYIGEDRFEVRAKIIRDLEAAGHLVKVEDYTNKVGFSERTDAIIEPKLSMQWFLKMEDMAKPALEAVEDGRVQFHPAKFINTYRHWMQNVRDWCISRQLWWGQRIPAYYTPGGDFVVAESAAEALEIARKQFDPDLQAADLRQDEDVLDTWFSSWLWPISVFDGIREPDNKDIRYYYPTNDLVTAPEILFFWVARMIMAGLEYRGEVPFKNVYLTGIVRDKLGRKMSKSLGNSPDPLELIREFGADGVRVGMLLTSPAGNDLPFDAVLCEQGRNFSNKIWNALRLVKGWEVDENRPQDPVAILAAEWFEARFNETLAFVEDQYNKYRLSDALMALYKLVWDDFCSWYLELIKPPFGEPIDAASLQQSVRFFGRLMQVMHPFMPFVSEEIWQRLEERKEGESIMVSAMPESGQFDESVIRRMDRAREVVTALRSLRADKGISPKIELMLVVRHTDSQEPDRLMDPLLMKMARLGSLNYATDKPEGAFGFMIDKTEFFVPAGDLVDPEEEIKKLEADLAYTEGFLKSVEKKLSNARFVDNAPEAVVEAERKKEADARARIGLLKDQIRNLKQ